eukprot:8653889-Pyramimonas_sp.AAC.1
MFIVWGGAPGGEGRKHDRPALDGPHPAGVVGEGGVPRILGGVGVPPVAGGRGVAGGEAGAIIRGVTE